VELKDILVLEARIREEAENFQILKKSLEQRGFFPWPQEKKKILRDEFTLRAIASVLLDYYTIAENIFKEIAKTIDGKAPQGSDWHKDLLIQMKLAIPGLRPPLLGKDTFALLDEYRRFRHLVRHLYGFNLIPEKVEALLKTLPEIDRLLENDLHVFFEKIKEVVIETYLNDEAQQ